MAEAAKWDAKLYEGRHSFVWKMAGDMAELLRPERGERILDIGCGTGNLTAELAKSGAVVTGIDQSAEMIRQAKASYPELDLRVMNARDLRFDEPFDAVFSNATLHWIKEEEQPAAQIASVLKPGGRFVAEMGGSGNVGILTKVVQKSWTELGFKNLLPNPWYFPSVGQYASLLEKHGLEVNYALLFDRPTPLEDRKHGLRTWIEMFGNVWLAELSETKKEELLKRIEANGEKTSLWQQDRWILDYRRLRVVARKKIVSAVEMHHNR